MRGADVTQAAMFSYRTLKERIPPGHSLRKLRTLVDGILVTLRAELEALYVSSGRPSIPPEHLLRASLIQTLYTIRSERQLVRKKAGSAINGRTTRHAGYAVSLRKRKRVEEIFGWAKTVGGLRKTKFIGLAKVKAQTAFTLAVYNLTRMATIFGWRLNTV